MVINIIMVMDMAMVEKVKKSICLKKRAIRNDCSFFLMQKAAIDLFLRNHSCFFSSPFLQSTSIISETSLGFHLESFA